MDKIIIGIAKTTRPRQWLKNLSIFGALVFTSQLFNQNLFEKTFLGFIFLTILVSSIYFINDVADANKDKLHPFKKNRPIAKGDLPIPLALFLSVLGICVAMLGALSLSNFFFYTFLSYLVLQLLYTFKLKDVVVLDILAIATGFVLRIYAGAFLIDAHLSVWFLLCTISVSLFLAAGKRRAELGILTENVASQHRKTLSLYTPSLLDSYLAMFATASWVSWALFTFFKEQETTFYLSETVANAPQLLDSIPLTILGSGKLLMITIPVVIFGIMRYLYIVYEGAKAETPEKVLTSDKALLASVFLWGILVLFIIYGVGSISN